jgi:hypothetical protein
MLRRLFRHLRPEPGQFSSKRYWEGRYEGGGTSGEGSYGKPARFKAEVLNDFVGRHDIQSVIEFGCGDGNQLMLSEYPAYTGFDVSTTAIRLCQEKFRDDDSKKFLHLSQYRNQKAGLTLSLDVIYHLVEDGVFHEHMSSLFRASSRFVGIYSSNTDDNSMNAAGHVRHRRFEDWINRHEAGWHLYQRVKTTLPSSGEYSIPDYPDFYFYGREWARSERY